MKELIDSFKKQFEALDKNSPLYVKLNLVGIAVEILEKASEDSTEISMEDIQDLIKDSDSRKEVVIGYMTMMCINLQENLK